MSCQETQLASLLRMKINKMYLLAIAGQVTVFGLISLIRKAKNTGHSSTVTNHLQIGISYSTFGLI